MKFISIFCRPVTSSEREQAHKIMSSEGYVDPLLAAQREEEQRKKEQDAQDQLRRDKEERERLVQLKAQQVSVSS
jgi:hypothetical protein